MMKLMFTDMFGFYTNTGTRSVINVVNLKKNPAGGNVSQVWSRNKRLE